MELITFKIAKGSLWVRQPHDLRDVPLDHDAPALATQFAKECNNYTHATIVRQAEKDFRRFAQDFFFDVFHKCADKGIYWGYDLWRTTEPVIGKDGKLQELEYITQVMSGTLPTPFLSWVKKSGADYFTEQPIQYKPAMSSIEEWWARQTVTVLQECEWQRSTKPAVYSLSLDACVHSAEPHHNTADMKKCWLYVKAGTKSGVRIPDISAGAKCKIKVLDNSDLLPEEFEGTSIIVEGMESDVLLEVKRSESRALEEAISKDIDQFDVKIEFEFDTTSISRRLDALKEIRRQVLEGESKSLANMLLGRPPLDASDNDFAEQITAMRDEDPQVYSM